MNTLFGGFVCLAAFVWLCGSAMAQEQGAATPALQPSPIDQVASTEIAAAEANRALISRRPEWLSGPRAEFPDSEKALGHNGDVVVRGLLGVDGRLRHATISVSSGAPALDANALAAANLSVFQPAEDVDRRAIPVMMSMPFKFYAYRSSDPGGGAAQYTCDQFVLDMDWWRSTFPEKTIEDHELYTMVLGLGVTSRLHLGTERAFAAESTADFTRRWLAAIETCRAHPDWRFTQAISPEGELIEGIAARLRGSAN